MTVDIREFSIEPEDGSDAPPFVYEVQDFIRQTEDAGAVIVRIGVDGEFDSVQADPGRTRDLTLLTRAIEALTAVRSELEILYAAGGGPEGLCLEYGPWGRCRTQEGHAGEHDFPDVENATWPPYVAREVATAAS